MSEKTWYTPGLIFRAHQNARGHQEICRGKYEQKAVDGTVIATTRELSAEFALHNGEYDFINPETGNTDRAADIRMGWFDLDSQAEQKGWDDHEKEIVARHMLREAAAKPGGNFSVWSKAPAAKPWPTYDEVHHKQVPQLAVQLGLVGEALAYEKETKNRAEIVALLEEALRDAQQPDVREEELTAA